MDFKENLKHTILDTECSPNKLSHVIDYNQSNGPCDLRALQDAIKVAEIQFELSKGVKQQHQIGKIVAEKKGHIKEQIPENFLAMMEAKKEGEGTLSQAEGEVEREAEAEAEVEAEDQLEEDQDEANLSDVSEE